MCIRDRSETERSFLLLPLGAGLKLERAGIPVQVITPTSPLGEALLGQAEDDSVEVFIGGARRDWDVVAVLQLSLRITVAQAGITITDANKQAGSTIAQTSAIDSSPG